MESVLCLSGRTMRFRLSGDTTRDNRYRGALLDIMEAGGSNVLLNTMMALSLNIKFSSIALHASRIFSGREDYRKEGKNSFYY